MTTAIENLSENINKWRDTVIWWRDAKLTAWNTPTVSVISTEKQLYTDAWQVLRP